MQTAITSIGILLTITGSIMLFKFGKSPFTNTTGKTIMYNEGELENNPKTKLKKTYETRANIGLYLTITGCVLQIASLFISII